MFRILYLIGISPTRSLLRASSLMFAPMKESLRERSSSNVSFRSRVSLLADRELGCLLMAIPFVRSLLYCFVALVGTEGRACYIVHDANCEANRS